MYTSHFDTFFSDSFLTPHRTVYVVSDSQLEELKKKQNQEELKALTPTEKETVKA